MAVSSSSVRQSSGSTRSAVSWSDTEERRHSPIPYRVGPLEYNPGVNCFCGQKAALWISWSNANPGRRYLKCYRAREGGCNFLGWYEGPHDPFVQSLLVDLRDAVWSLKRQEKALNAAIADATVKAEEQKKEVEECKIEVAAALAEREEMRAKFDEMAKERFLPRVLLVAAFAFFLLLCGGQN